MRRSTKQHALRSAGFVDVDEAGELGGSSSLSSLQSTNESIDPRQTHPSSPWCPGTDVGERDDLAVLDGEQDVPVAAERIGEEVRARRPSGSPLIDAGDAGVEAARYFVGLARPAGRQQQHQRRRAARRGSPRRRRRRGAWRRTRDGARHRDGVPPGLSSRLKAGPGLWSGARNRPPFRAAGARWISSNTRASSCSRSTASPCRDGAPVDHGAGGGGGRRPHRLPGGREGPGAGGRPRQGGRHQARRQRRRGPHPRRRTSSAWTSRATS